jgi:putative transcriptional regulator
MEEELFEELLASVKEMVAIENGEAQPSRMFIVKNPKEIRERYDMTQAQFARLLGISARTLEKWEQGERHPTGAARVLLQVAARHPDCLLDTIKQMSSG